MPSMPARRAIAAGWARVRSRAAFAVVAIWAIVTMVAVAAIAPAWAWWNGALGHTIDGARLLGSPDAGTLVELFRETPFGARVIAAAAVAAAAIVMLLNPFLAGGLLGALAAPPGPARGRGARFAADGVRFYGPLLRVALIVWPIAAVAIPVAAVVAAMPFASGPRPALSLAAGGLVVAGGALVATMLVDLARIHVVRTGTRRAGAAVAAALAIGLRQARRLLPVALVFALAFVVAGAALAALRGWLAGDTWPTILLGVVAQQAYALARTGLRATMVASEQVLVEADAEARALAAAAAGASFASVASGEERPEVLVVVQGEAGEGGLHGDEGGCGGELPPQVPGRLAPEGDGRRGDADAEEPRPPLPVPAGDRPRDEPAPIP
jgi:hypothetical protein